MNTGEVIEKYWMGLIPIHRVQKIEALLKEIECKGNVITYIDGGESQKKAITKWLKTIKTFPVRVHYCDEKKSLTDFFCFYDFFNQGRVQKNIQDCLETNAYMEWAGWVIKESENVMDWYQKNKSFIQE